ncbi:MAG TPA: glycosyl hydrolase-related protein [Opitutaceae bacterium]|nr:glycosyl hydrolase-related protein [Opitutaceae bacterium]
MRRSALWTILVGTLVARLAAQPGPVSTHTIWSIGRFDHSYLDFRPWTPGDITYVAGRGEPARDWSEEQRVGSVYRVRFTLPETPTGRFTLTIGTMTFRPRVPVLRLAVNGHTGEFFLEPRLAYYLGDHPFPNCSAETLTIAIPASFLRQGDNELALAWQCSPPDPEGRSAIAGVYYDALRLDQAASPDEVADDVEVRLKPTVFFRQRGADLVEQVEGVFRFHRGVPSGSATLVLDGHRCTVPIAGGEFGERRVEFEVPAWTGVARGELAIDAGRPRVQPVSLTAERRWTVFVVPHTHLDIGYSDYQSKVAESQARVLDEAADLIRDHPAFRYSTDGSWAVEQLLATRAAPRREALLALIRDGKIGLPAQYCNLMTGYASLESLERSLAFSARLAREHALPFDYANITDVPSYSGDYPSILAAAGIRYFLAGGNGDRAPVLYYGRWNERSPFWWEGPDGGRVLFWYSRTYQQTRYLFGLPPQLTAGRESLPVFLQAYSTPEYRPDVTLIYGTQEENTDLIPATATFVDRWNETYAFPHLRYGTFRDFMHELDAKHGRELPSFRGGLGAYWEDGIASDAAYVARDRENQQRALSAETLAMVAHVNDPDVHAPRSELGDIWRNLELFAEHTWTADRSVTMPDHEESVRQLAVKNNFAVQAQLEIDDVVQRSVSQLVDRVHVPAGTLVLFNSLSWPRNALVETDLPENAALEDLSTHAPVRFEVLSHREHFLHVRFLVRDLPAVGYKCLRLGTAAAPEPRPPVRREVTVENAFYRITVDPASGAIASIVDKSVGRELIDRSSAYKFGQYLYVTGGDGRTWMTDSNKQRPKGDLAVHPAGEGEYRGAQRAPWGWSLRLRSRALNTPVIALEVLLPDDEKKIEFRYEVRKDYVTTKEAAYFAFPVAVPSPQFAYASQIGWVDPARDLLPGACLEWFCVQEWMAVHDDHLSVGIVPLDAPLACFGDINRGAWPGRFQPGSPTLFSYVMNNYWGTNFCAGQGGNFIFRYVITSDSTFAAPRLLRTATAALRPVEIDTVLRQEKTGNPPRPLPAEGMGFLEIGSPEIELVTWKPAEDGQGSILRLREVAGRSAKTVIRFHAPIQSASLCNAMEEASQPVTSDGQEINLTFRPHEILTVRVTLEGQNARE